MERIFRPNKWFVIFCALLILVWVGLQCVANLRLAEEAKSCGLHVFTWAWPNLGWNSSAEVTEASVLKKTDTDAVVKIQGRQVVKFSPSGLNEAAGKNRSEVVDCNATLTFYRASGHWVLGKVELQ